MVFQGKIREHGAVLAWALPLFDITAAILSGALALWAASIDTSPEYRLAILLGAIFTPFLFSQVGIYRAWRGHSITEEIRAVALGWAALFAMLVITAALVQAAESFSRMWLLSWFLLGLLFLWAGRSSLRILLRHLRSIGFNHRRVIIVGHGSLIDSVANGMSEAAWAGMDLIGIVSGSQEHGSGVATKDLAQLGSPNDLARIVAEHEIDQVWLVYPLRAESDIENCLHQLRHTTADIKFIPDIFGLRLLNHSYSDFAGMPVLNLTSSPIIGTNRLFKEAEDRLFAALILLLISPLMLAIAAAVKYSSPGPVLFRQQRHGWDGQKITVYKFRSMNVHQECNGGVTQACRNDSRVTRVGAFLRRTSLDELPQFINVLQGRMSIVGPRPHAIAHNEQYKEIIENYMLRHKVKPGITGWAQINGWRGETDTLDKMQKRVDHDLYYIENWSLWLDVKIIFLTVLRGFFDRNAY